MFNPAFINRAYVVSVILASLILVVAAGLLVSGRGDVSVAGLSADEFAHIALGAALVLFIGGSLASSYRGRLAEAFRHLFGWAAVMLLLVTGYAYRGELTTIAERVVTELSPEGSVMDVTDSGDRPEVRIRKRLGGHFIARTRVAGGTFDMIVDTGASTVVLTQEDATAAGLDVAALRYSVPVQTANGETRAARVRLPALAIGPITREGVEALVAQPGLLHQSLLGMSFLSRLQSYEFSRDTLRLRG